MIGPFGLFWHSHCFGLGQMIELQSILDLISGKSKEIPIAPSVDFLSQEFSSLLFSLMTHPEGDFGQPPEQLDTSPTLLSPEEFSSQSRQTEYQQNPYPSLFMMDLINPLVTPVSSETGWANPLPLPPPGAFTFQSTLAQHSGNLYGLIQQEPYHSPKLLEETKGSLVQNDLYRIEKPFITATEVPHDDRFYVPYREAINSQGIKNRFTDLSSIRLHDGQKTIVPSISTEKASENNQTFLTQYGMVSNPKESLNPFQIKKEPVTKLFESPQRVSPEEPLTPSQKNHLHSLSIEEVNPTFLFETVDETSIPKASHRLGLNPPEVIGHQDSVCHETHLLTGEESAIFSKELPLLEGRAEPPLPPSSKIELFPLDQQIGHALLRSVRNGQERIRMRLDPPELGTLYIKISRDQDLLKATVWAEHPATKALLETHQQELRHLLEGDGFKLDKFEVFVQQEFDPLAEKREFNFFKEEERMHEFHEKGHFCSSEPIPLSSPGVSECQGLSQYINKIV